MQRKIVLALVVLVMLFGLVGCTTDNNSDQDMDVEEEIYVEVTNGTGAANVFLFGNQGDFLAYRSGVSAAKFSNLDSGTYHIAVGDKDSSLEEREVVVDGKEQLEIEMDQDGDPIEVKIAVENQDGNAINDATVKSLRAGNEQAKQLTDSTGTAVLEIWPGLIYDYQVVSETGEVEDSKSDYVYFKQNLDEEIQFVVQRLDDIDGQRHIFQAGSTKEIDLGTIVDGESVFVGISPLDTNFGRGAGDTYSASLDVSYDSSATSALSLSGIDGDSTSDFRVQKDKLSGVDYSGQAKVDKYLREQEKELLGSANKIEANSFSSDFNLQQSNYSEGDIASFWTLDFDKEEHYKVEAELIEKRENAYIFVDQDVEIDSTLLAEVSDIFSNQVFSTTMDKFASNDYVDFDIDGNQAPIILLTPAKGNWLGYFHSLNYTDGDKSNGRDMFYVSSDIFTDSNRSKEEKKNLSLGTLAHEFQHLIYFNQKHLDYSQQDQQTEWVTDIWANEGLSMLAMRLNGYYDYNTSREVDYLNGSNRESLLFWDGQGKDYGASGLFLFKLYQELGPDIIKEIVSSSADPVEVISEHAGKEFNSYFLDWILANQINNLSSDLSDQYGYSLPLPTNPAQETISESSLEDFEVDSTAIKYYEIEGDGSQVDLTINNLNAETGVILYRK
ncbi:MAG: hypothetical protein ACQEP9_04225 [Bacillota bacterium]